MPETYIRRYGIEFPKDKTDFDIEMICFLRHKAAKPDPEYPFVSNESRFHHYRNIHAWMWPEHEKYYNEWMERLQYAFCTYDNVTVSGCGGSSKSTEAGKYALTWWRVNSWRSLVAATSTTLGESRQRIWGRLVELTRESRVGEKAWGKLASSLGILRHVDEKGESELNCMKILPGGKENVKEGYNRLKGWHAQRALLILDERQEMTKAIIDGALNLKSSTIEYQEISLGNGVSWFDPLGDAMLPLDGVESVTPNTGSWKGKYGYVLHLNGLNSPNIGRPKKKIIPFLPTQESIDDARKRWGEDSILYWQQIIGFPNPGGNKDAIISAQVFAASQCMRQAVWQGRWSWLFGLDPAYSGGDNCILYPAKFGVSVFGIWTIEFQAPIKIDRSVSNKTVPIHKQIALQVVDHLRAVGANITDLAMDVTAEGKAVLIELRYAWGTGAEPVQVEFGGAASDLPLDEVNKKLAHEEYTSKTGELWYSMRRFIEKDQVRGLTIETIRQFSERRYKLVNSRIQIEPKTVMKQADRLGYSPDEADAATLVVMLARMRNTLRSSSGEIDAWLRYAQKNNLIMDEKKSYAEAPIA